MDTQALSNARKNLSQLVQSAQEQGTQHVITVNGSNAAMLMSYDDYESMVETLELLQDQQAIKELIQSEKDFNNGDYITLEELEKEYEKNNHLQNRKKRIRKTA